MAAPEAALEVTDVGRKFGRVRALDGVSFDLAPGEWLALFGPNGAGKTTLVRILTLGLRPTRGRFRVAGRDPLREERSVRGMLGVISHESYLYDDLTARENLELFAALYGHPRPAERAAELLDRFGLTSRVDDPVRGYSRGMRQRVSLARAIVHDPSIVFLDEPFAGLDVQAARVVRATLAELHGEGRTILLVTHDLARGLEMSDRWLLLERGRIAAQGRSCTTDLAALEAHIRPPSSGVSAHAAKP